MYSIEEACKKLSISKPTLYKHMVKVNIPKGTKLADKHIELLKESILSKSGDKSKVNTLTQQNKDLTLEVLELKKELRLKEEELLNSLTQNMTLQNLINNKDVYIDNMQKQIIELNDKLKDTTVLLLNAPKKLWWKR